ncbi:MAG TPA: sigma factor-like helix-turn-helix DNA-binding protein [Nocardioides sp.]|nr:sigma factor-like helix-turn-helix DNA-binding protein [Nocardioides sp.]
MKGGFEEWAAARTPSLLAFASALTEDDRAADAAVTRALARIRSTWDQVAREDPDLEARRQVVRACSSSRRAAVVLRALEGRSDAEIAGVLGCSESAARRHLHRGLGEAERRPGEESSVRDHLVARAGAAPTQLLTRPPTPALEEPPRRRSGWLAALAMIALLGGVAFVSHASRTPAGVIDYPQVDVPVSWRYESYAGVQVQVPDTWGWGGSPVTSGYFPGPRHLGACGTSQAAMLSPEDDSSYVSVLTGFVGRPAIMDPRCVAWGADGSMPGGDAFWFDSPLPVGVKPLGGTVAETRQVGAQRVTAFSDDGDLRRQILGSAELVGVDGNGCPTNPVVRPEAGPDHLEPTSLSVCVYSQDTGVTSLFWSGKVPEPAAGAYAAAVAHTSGDATRQVSATRPCWTPTGRWVALGLTGAGGTRWDLVNLGCGRIQLAGGAEAALTPRTVQPWASGGATAYVSPPRGRRDLDRYLTGPAG